ncbi:MAG: DUF6719 family protein [Afipia sp.]
MMSLSFRRMLRLGAGVSLTMLALTATARADIVGRESDITDLRLGQRIYVDDGSCPAGQIKEIAGMRLTASGVERTRQCVDRKGKR